MLEARKENKVYSIDERMKDRYLKEGFDIYNENGEIVEHTPLKKIKYSDHLKKLQEATAEKDEEIKSLKETVAALQSQEATAEKDEEIKSLKETVAALQSQEATAENVIDLLKMYAQSKDIDIGSSTSANGILTKILEIEKV